MIGELSKAPTLGVCAWCDPSDPHGPADVRLVWQHDDTGCWCEGIDGNDRRHVSWSCRAHLPRERRDLADLGLRVVSVGEVRAL